MKGGHNPNHALLTVPGGRISVLGPEFSSGSCSGPTHVRHNEASCRHAFSCGTSKSRPAVH